jgi:aminoglycoside/choline kinase family phosphotransferase
MATPADVPLERLARLVRRLSGADAPLSAEEMPGGASTRRFFRVALGNGRTGVAMYVPEVGKPDEIAKVDEGGRRWPFLEVRDLLEARGVNVPKVLGDASEEGFLVVEDLGDDTLARYLERAPDRREALYRLAVADLARAQRALATLPDGSIVGERAFDYDLLRWEIDHFREWALEARGIELGVPDRTVFDRAAEFLARAVAALPRGFVHRDYQSRNLMVLPEQGSNGDGQGERLVWIDFQDALLGPRVYDLVALLGDSYQTFDDTFVSERLDEFARHHPEDATCRATLGREFDLVTVQRKLKDAGRFVFILHKRGDSSYLRFVEPTITKVRVALARLRGTPELDDLAALLDRIAGPLEG